MHRSAGTAVRVRPQELSTERFSLEFLVDDSGSMRMVDSNLTNGAKCTRCDSAQSARQNWCAGHFSRVRVCCAVLCCAVPVVGRWEEAKERLLILLEMLAYIPVQVQPLARSGDLATA